MASSTVSGLVAAVFTLIVAPRYYDYDKVLFYTSGLALAWRYADTRGLGTLIAAALVTVVAGLFRYDNGLFLIAVTVATLVACHWRDPAALVRRTTAYSAAVLLGVTPVAVAWQQSSGLSEVVRQIRTYARVEGARTAIFTLPTLRVQSGEPVLRALGHPENRTVLLYYAMLMLLPIATAVVVVRRVHPPHREERSAHETTKVAVVVVLGVLVAAFILRDPVGARFGAAAPVAAILAAWLTGRLVPARGARHHARPLAIALGGGVALWSALILTGRSPADLLAASQTVAGGLIRIRALTSAPTSLSVLPDAPATEGMVRYVRECTPPGSRVLVSGFVPQLYFFADRSFAGGTPVFFGEHWSTPLDQERTVQQLQRQFVALAIVDPDFSSTYERVSAYVSSAFVLAGFSTFGNPHAPAGGYQVFLHRGVATTLNDERWNLPCASGWIAARK
jgi:hypothetical protein